MKTFLSTLALILFASFIGLHAQNWNEILNASASDGVSFHEFGCSICIDGDYAIVGAYGDDEAANNAGAAYIFIRSGNTWVEQVKLTATDAAASDRFGHSVSISGDYAIIGARLNDDAGSNSGSAYIFERSGNTWIQQTKLTASDAALGDYFGVSVSIDGDYAVVGADRDDDAGSSSGSAYVFVRSGSIWNQQAKLTAADAAADDSFGDTVSLDGNRVIVGAHGDDDFGNRTGSAYIFRRSGNSWNQEEKFIASDAAAEDRFGHSVSIEGDYAIVGARDNGDDGEDSGSAYIFKRIGSNTWVEQTKLTASDAATGDNFGWSVSIDGDIAIVGAYRDDDAGSGSGSAYVYMRSLNTWSEQVKLTASDASSADEFGYSVSISGDDILVGAPNKLDIDTRTGAAYFYNRPITADVNPLPNLISACEVAPTAPTANNGTITATPDVSLPITAQGTTVVTWTYDDGLGNTLTQTQNITIEEIINDNTVSDCEMASLEEIINATASDAASQDQFGYSVSIDGDYAIVGAPFDDDAGNSSGSAYIFVRSGDSWTQQVKLMASDADADDRFGFSVSIKGNYAIVGANGDDDAGGFSGSAYVFMRSGSSWTEQTKLIASDTATGDNFGYSVSIDDDIAVIGARFNDDTGSAYIFARNGSSWIEQDKITASDATADYQFGWSVAIDGNYIIVGSPWSSDEASNSGSAYIFARLSGGWFEQAKLTASDADAEDRFGWSVSISGDYVVAGAYGNDDVGDSSGSAYVFKRNDCIWSEQTKLTDSMASSGDQFGYSVAIDGNYVVVGARFDNEPFSDSGSAILFENDGSSWLEIQKITPSSGDLIDYFGWSVAISCDDILIGSPFNDDDGQASGSVYLFKGIPAQTYTFTDGVWEPEDPSGTATANDDIIIASGSAVISADTSFNSITVGPGTGLTVEAGVTLDIAEGITLESSSTSYPNLILDGTINGTVSYERHVNINGSGSTGSNDLISAPLTGQAFNEFVLENPNILNNGTLYLFGPFNKTNGTYVNWTGTETSTLDAGIGYRAASSDNSSFTFTGNVENTPIFVPVGNLGTNNQKWNLIGNPYPSYMDALSFLTTNLSVFSGSTAGIWGYDGSAQNGWTVVNLANAAQFPSIAPGQGFFVSASGASIIEFQPDWRVIGNTDDYIVGRNAQLQFVTLELRSDASNFDTDFYFNPAASSGFDLGYDAEIFDTTAPDFAIYSHLVQDNVGNAIALQTMHPNDLSDVSIPLGVNASQGQQITFSISDMTIPESVNVYLDDVVANASTMLNDSDYIMTSGTNLSGTGRFFLRFSEDTLSNTESSIDSLNIYGLPLSQEIVISGQLRGQAMATLYDIHGRKVFSSGLNVSNLENRINVSILATGVYVITVQDRNRTYTQKVIIK